MSKFHDDQEWQRALLHHPALKPPGVDPLWKVIAILGWALVFLLTALVARGEELIRETREIHEKELPLREGGETPNLRGHNTGDVAHPKDWVGEGNKPLMRSLTAMCSRSLDGMAPQNFKKPHEKWNLISRHLACLAGKKSLVTKEFLDAMEQVESGRDAGAVGDNGRARGSFQFWAVAWSQVNTLRKQQGLESLNYYLSTNRTIARSFAVTYLRWLETSLAATLRRSPTIHELYAAWNLGPSGFRARGFSLARCPRRTRSAAQRVENLVRLHAPAGRTNGLHLHAPLLAGAF